MKNKKQILTTLLSVLLPVFLVSAVAYATTVGNNVSVGNDLTVTGATTLTGALTANSAVTIVPSSNVDALTITGTNLISINQAFQIDATAFTGATNVSKAAIINFTAVTGGGADYGDTNTGLDVEARWNNVTDSDGASFTGIDTNVDNYNVMQSDASESANGIQVFAVNKAAQTVGTTRGALIAAKNNDGAAVMANAAELFGAEIYTYNALGNTVGTNKGLVVSPKDDDTIVGGAGSVLRGIEILMASAKEYSEEQGLLIWTNTAGKTIDSAIKIQSAAGTFATGLDTSGAVGFLTKDIKLQYGETIDNTTDGTLTFTGKGVFNGSRVVATSGYEYWLQANGDITSTGDATHGAKTFGLGLSLTRPLGTNTANTDMEDALIKGVIQNKATVNTTNYKVKGIIVEAKNRSGAGNAVDQVYGMELSGKLQDSGTTANYVRGAVIRADLDPGTVANTDVKGIRVEVDLDANAPSDSAGVQSYYQSQGAYTTPLAAFQVSALTARSWQYGLVIDANSVGTADIRLSSGALIKTGTAAPTGLTAPMGSLYLRTVGNSIDGSDTLYVNTDGGTTWVAR